MHDLPADRTHTHSRRTRASINKKSYYFFFLLLKDDHVHVEGVFEQAFCVVAGGVNVAVQYGRGRGGPITEGRPFFRRRTLSQPQRVNTVAACARARDYTYFLAPYDPLNRTSKIASVRYRGRFRPARPPGKSSSLSTTPIDSTSVTTRMVVRFAGPPIFPF